MFSHSICDILLTSVLPGEIRKHLGSLEGRGQGIKKKKKRSGWWTGGGVGGLGLGGAQKNKKQQQK